MLDELARVHRLGMPCEVRRRSYDGEAEVAGDGYGDHVSIDHLTELDPGIVAALDDIGALVAHGQVEPHVGMSREEASEHGVTEKEFGTRGHEEAERVPWLRTELADRGHDRVRSSPA